MGWLAAAISIPVCFLLWFRDVRRVMRERKHTVESAKIQPMLYREKVSAAQNSLEAAAVLERSESIYRQAVDLYNKTLQKRWVRLPALLMGFRSL